MEDEFALVISEVSFETEHPSTSSLPLLPCRLTCSGDFAQLRFSYVESLDVS